MKALRKELARQPDRPPLDELRAAVGLECTLPANHYVLKDMGLIYKKDAPGQRAGPV